ncbi:MAG TPA: SRPBCC family protein [Stellaceae bacterium]|jgi:phenylpropionate dioxygenase-like ring-hydroxylating dioxygenase large terminal subunit|nr:SRPBCC family protein [Stellaceae bacterium]
MRRQDQIAEARKLLGHLSNRTTALAESVYRNPVTDYTCPKQAERERELFFRKGAFNVGLSALLPKPGDWMTHDYSGVPILLSRDREGKLGAFLNVCRHRGARVAEGSGSGQKDFSCPYHGWCYGLDGTLTARPDEPSFAAASRATHGLRPLPVVEKYGMIWVSPDPEGQFDVDDLLGGMGEDLAAYGLDTYHHYETRVLRRKMNWKLAVDTFGETYHLQHLHPDTVSPLFHSNRCTFDAFGPNHRMVAARRTLDDLRKMPEHEWDVFDNTVVICVLFPNTVFTFQRDHVETWHMFPGDKVDEVVMYVSLYIPVPVDNPRSKEHWDRNFDLLMATVEKEDFPTCEGMQLGFGSGAQDAITFGRNEPALQHFHKSITAALAAM